MPIWEVGPEASQSDLSWLRHEAKKEKEIREKMRGEQSLGCLRAFACFVSREIGRKGGD